MTTKERIDVMIKRARTQENNTMLKSYWHGYKSALNELKLTVKPNERSANDEPS